MNPAFPPFVLAAFAIAGAFVTVLLPETLGRPMASRLETLSDSGPALDSASSPEGGCYGGGDRGVATGNRGAPSPLECADKEIREMA